MTQDNGVWSVAPFTVHHSTGKDGGSKAATVAGWVKGFFGLDFRPVLPDDFGPGEVEDASAWVLTHIPTGLAMQGIRGTFDEAKLVAAAFEGMCDWSFTDAAEAKRVGTQVAEFRKRHAEHLIVPTETIPPWHSLASGIDEPAQPSKDHP